MKNAVEIYVELLDEGSTTWRPTFAVPVEKEIYKILATPNYDAEDESWAYLPGSRVRLERVQSREGRILVARNPNPNVIRIEVERIGGEHMPRMVSTDALDLGGGLYEVMPTPHYNAAKETWKSPPGTIVRLQEKIWRGTEQTYLTPL